jgi:hypothetical protein
MTANKARPMLLQRTFTLQPKSKLLDAGLHDVRGHQSAGIPVPAFYK